MTLVEKVRARLLASPVSVLVTARIYPVVIPQTATPLTLAQRFPAITVRRAAADPEHTLTGSEAFACRNTIEVACMATSYSAAVSLADAVRGSKVAPLLDGWTDDDGYPMVRVCAFVDEHDEADPLDDDSADVIFSVVQQYQVLYEEQEY